ncbi:unnamed protein product [Sympodiomycopsis kandeliae]
MSNRELGPQQHPNIDLSDYLTTTPERLLNGSRSYHQRDSIQQPPPHISASGSSTASASASQSALPPAMDPIFPVLEALNLDPQEIFAATGPTAPAYVGQTRSTSFSLPFDDANRNRVLYQIWLSVFQSLPAIENLLPNLQKSSPQPVTPQKAVDFLASHDYNLSRAQNAIVPHITSKTSSASLKGKSPAHHSLQGPSSPARHLSRSDSPSSADETDQQEGSATLGPEYAPERRGMPCGHVFSKGEAIWRCRDCALDDTCVQCAPCFMASIHTRENHDVVFSVSSSAGGCCDCGDQEAWVKDVGCSYHCHSEEEETEMTDSSDDADNNRPPDLAFEIGQGLAAAGHQEAIAQLRESIVSWIDFILTALNHAPEEQKLFGRSFVVGVAAHAVQKVSALQGLDEWAAAIRDGEPYRTSTSPANTDNKLDPRARLPQPPGAYDFEQFFDFAAGSPAKPGTPGEMWGPLPQDPNSPMPHEPLRQQGRRKYALLLWNDEKHSFTEVIDSVKEALGSTDQEGRAIADRVDQKGRHVLAVSSDLSQLVNYARRMHGIELEVTIRPAFDIFCEELAHWLIAVIKDIAEANIYLPSKADPTALAGNASVLRLLVSSILLDEWSPATRKPDSFSSPHMRPEFFDPRHLCKLDGLLLMDHKLWKEARNLVRGWYMAIVARKEGRRAIAFRFAAVYAKIIEVFILREREPEHSVVLLTVQLFSVPSIGSDLVRHYGFLEKLLAILHSIYTGSVIPESSTLILPPREQTAAKASPTATLLKQVFCRHVFYDVRYLLQSEGVKAQLVSDPRHITYCLDFLALFVAFLPEIRQRDHHVEFESNELWVAVFQVCQLLARQAKLLGEAFEKTSASDATYFLRYAIQRTIHACLQLERLHPDTHPEFSLHKIQLAKQDYDVVQFRVDRQFTSFHHPVHWYVAELCKRLGTITRADLVSMGKIRIAQLLADLDQSELLFALDFPLRVVTKIAQVKIGLWVRNGSSTRGQATHYRDVAMRASMYDQDLFLLQAGLTLVQDPNRLLVNYIDRFRLQDYFDGRPGHLARSGVLPEDALDADHEVQLAEEFILLLHFLLSEASIACAWPLEKVIRREIIHFLALSQGTYSAVTRYIPEYMTEHPSFERLLTQVSKFRAPDGTSDLGIFELKDEYYDEVNPFFYHYTRNQRERAEEQLRLREKKKGRSPDDYVPVPAKALLGEGSEVFATTIANVFLSPVLERIVFYTLLNNCDYLRDNQFPEALLDATLQLIVVGLVELEVTFVEEVLAKKRDDIVPLDAETNPTGVSLLRVLCMMEEQIKDKALKSKISWCLNRAASYSSPMASVVLSTNRQGVDVSSSQKKPASKANVAKQSMEAKKAAAKARQQAIMQKFSAQQKSLLESLDGDEEEEGSSATKAKKEEGMDVDERDADLMDVEDEESETEEPLGACIMCQEELEQDGSYGCLGLVSHSTVIRVTPRNDVKALKEVTQLPLSLDRVSEFGQSRETKMYTDSSDTKYSPKPNLTSSGGGFPQGDHKSGFVASTCGHLLHVRCFEMYYKSIEQRHGSQVARNHAEDLSRNEFVCPLCKSLGNAILPVPVKKSAKTAASGQGNKSVDTLGRQVLDETPISDWLRKINIDILKTSGAQFSSTFQETATGTGCFSHWYADSSLQSLKETPIADVELPEGVDEPTLTMLLRLMATLRPMALNTRPSRVNWQSRSILAPVSRKLYIPEEIIGYTLSMMEVSQRGFPAQPHNNVAMNVSDSSIGLIRSLLFCLKNVVAIEALNVPGKATSTKTNFMNGMRQGLLKRLLPHWSSDEAVRYPLLLRDPLTILVETAAIAPEYLAQVTSLMYYATLVQTIFGLAQPSAWPHTQGPASASRGLAHLDSAKLDESAKKAIRECFPDVRWTVGNIVGFVGYARGNISLGIDLLDDDTLAKLLCSYTLPFLRRAAILRRAVCGDKIFGTRQSYPSSADADAVEYVRLLAELQVPTPAQALPVRAERQSPISSMIEGWVKHAYAPLASLFRPLPINHSQHGAANGQGGASTLTSGSGRGTPLGSVAGLQSGTQPVANSSNLLHMHANQPQQILQLEHPHVYELVSLPHDLTTLLQYSQRNVCKRCAQVPPDPALCLFCGQLVCYQSFCCLDSETNKGECNRHVAECGGNVGLFFKLKANVIFILYYSKGTFTFSPYLDSHGEVDVGLQKGRPQRLHRQRADELRRTWLSGGLATMVARKIEASMDAGGWDTT